MSPAATDGRATVNRQAGYSDELTRGHVSARNHSALSVADEIVFLCPACGMKLNVPASMGGITGPCPSCQVLIQAPFSMRQQQPPAQYVQAPAPATQPSYPKPQATPQHEYSRTPRPVSSEPIILRPEPRQLPGANPDPPEPSPGSAPNRAGWPAPARKPLPRHRSAAKAVAPFAFLCPWRSSAWRWASCMA